MPQTEPDDMQTGKIGVLQTLLRYILQHYSLLAMFEWGFWELKFSNVWRGTNATPRPTPSLWFSQYLEHPSGNQLRILGTKFIKENLQKL